MIIIGIFLELSRIFKEFSKPVIQGGRNLAIFESISMIHVFIRTTGESGYVSEQTVCLSAIRLHPEEILGRQYSLNCGRTKHKKRRNDYREVIWWRWDLPKKILHLNRKLLSCFTLIRRSQLPAWLPSKQAGKSSKYITSGKRWRTCDRFRSFRTAEPNLEVFGPIPTTKHTNQLICRYRKCVKRQAFGHERVSHSLVDWKRCREGLTGYIPKQAKP